MYTNPVQNNGTYLRLLRAHRVASQRADAALQRQLVGETAKTTTTTTTAGSARLRGNVAELQSQLRSMQAAAASSVNRSAVSAYQDVTSTASGLLTQAVDATGTSAQAQAFVAALRTAANRTIGGVQVFAGDPTQQEQVVTTQSATSGSLTGSSVAGVVTVASTKTGNISDVTYAAPTTSSTTLNLNLLSNTSTTTFTVAQEAKVVITDTWDTGRSGSSSVVDSSGNTLGTTAYHVAATSASKDSYTLTLQPGTYTVKVNGDAFLNTTHTVSITQSVAQRAFSFNLNGQAYRASISPGTRTLEQTANDLAAAINTQTTLLVGRDLTIKAEGGKLVVRSLAAGASSSVSGFSGLVADAAGLTSGTSVNGKDAVTETRSGPNADLTTTLGGRSITFANLNKYADQLQEATLISDSAKIRSITAALTTSLTSTRSSAQASASALASDSASRMADIAALQQKIDKLLLDSPAGETVTKVTTEASPVALADLVNAKARAEATSKALQGYVQYQQTTWGILFGRRSQ